MQRSDDGIGRRSLLQKIGGSGLLALSGCTTPLEDSPSFDSAHTEYIDRRLLTSEPGFENEPYDAALIIDRSQFQRRLRLDAVSEARAEEWKSIDFSSSFLAIFSSAFAVLPEGELRRDVVSGALQDSTFVFEVSRSDCPPKVSDSEPWAVRFVLVERWSRNGQPAPETVSVEANVLQDC